VRSHNAVAAAVSQGRAEWGIAIEPVAAAYELGFLPIRVEEYDFAVASGRWDRPAVSEFRRLLRHPATVAKLASLGFRANRGPDGSGLLPPEDLP
jgi:putative molybdopterin biosynthesis protein